MKRTGLTLICGTLSVIGFSQNYAPNDGKAGITDVAGSDPGLFYFMIMIALLFVGVVILATVLILLLAAIIFLMVLCGVISLSVLAGWYQRSFSKGAAFFVKCCSTLVGSFVGLITSAFFTASLSTISTVSTIIIGTLIGAIFGLMIANFCLKAFQLITRRIFIRSKYF